jgi:hypothetical protein
MYCNQAAEALGFSIEGVQAPLAQQAKADDRDKSAHKAQFRNRPASLV